MKHQLIASAFFIMLINFATAQETIYFSKDSSARKASKQKASSERTVVKISPLGFISGSIPVYVEREINETFSLQVGVGLTTRNYLREWANNLELEEAEIAKTTWNGDNSSTYENYNSLNDFTNRKSSLGYSFSIQPRIYFESEGLEGTFLGLSYERSRYNFSTYKIVTGNGPLAGQLTTNNFREYDNISEIAAYLGTQTLYHKISLEYGIGIAIRTTAGRRYAYSMDNNGAHIDGFSEIKKTSPALGLGFKVGYHF